MPKKIFYAKYLGSSVPCKTWEGSVNSIYSKAVNLLHPSEILISIVKSIDQMTDYGIMLKDFDIVVSGISNSSRFQWKDSQIIFLDIIIDISRASSWSGILSEIDSILSMNIIRIKRAYLDLAPEDGLSPFITKKFENLYSKYANSIVNKAVERVDSQRDILIDLSPLVGVGIGFTPSGDDFLTGVMLYEAVSGINIIDRESLESKLSGTTEGGRTLLSLALGNSFPFYLKKFAKSISTGDIFSKEVVQSVVMHGSTSGSDALTGFLWAAEKNEKNSLINLT